MEIYANNVITEPSKSSIVPRKKKRSNSEVAKYPVSSKKGFFGNMKDNASKELLKMLAFGAAGAVLYPLVPTVVQAVTEWDMSGAKGLVAGVATASAIGLAVGRPEMAVGACSAAGTHLLYAKGTKVIENLTNTQIFRLNPDSVVYTN